MTLKQLPIRLSGAQPRITELEKAELSGSLTLRSLECAAEARGGRFMYALVPEHPLADVLKEQAKQIAHQQLMSVEQTMNLEDQVVHDLGVHKVLEQHLIDELLRKPARLWDKK